MIGLAPSNGLPMITQTTKWTLRRAWGSPRCAVSKKTIWPWQLAWRRRTDQGLDYVVHSSVDLWVTEDEYLVLKLKGETDDV